MRNLVCGPEECLVELPLLHAVDEEALREGDGGRERSAATESVWRDLDDPQLVVRKGSECLRVVVERRLHARDHLVECVPVRGMMEDLERDIVPPILAHRVLRGEHSGAE